MWKVDYIVLKYMLASNHYILDNNFDIVYIFIYIKY